MIRSLLGPLDRRSDLTDVDLEEVYAQGSPSLRANFVVALDGVIALDGVSGALGGAADRAVFATLRAVTDVVLVAAGTARAEGYGPAWLQAPRRDRRARRGQEPLPTVAVVTSSGDLDAGARLFVERRDDQPDPPPVLVFTTESAPARRIEPLAEVATVVRMGADAVDLPGMVEALQTLGLGRILCEGGPGLFGQLVGAGLVDELCLTHAPLLGGPGHPVLSGDPRADAGIPARFSPVSVLEGDGLLLARYAAAAGGVGS